MKPKRNYTAGALDLCQTPTYALDPILPYLEKEWEWWEPAVGNGNILRTMTERGFMVYGSDILRGDDYFEKQPEADWDASITNPPYSLKFKWLRRCYELGKPFALLVPVEMIGCQKSIRCFEEFGLPEIMLLDNRVHFEMPQKGLDGSGAQFPVLWLCHNILPERMMLGHVEYPTEVVERMRANARRVRDARKRKLSEVRQASNS